MVLLEEAVVESKADLRQLERKHFDSCENVVNKNRPYWSEDEKKKQLADYRFNNNFKAYRDQTAAGIWGEHFTCECGGSYTLLLNKNARMKQQKHCVFIAQATPVE